MARVARMSVPKLGQGDQVQGRMSELLVRLTAPTVRNRQGFCCGIVLKDGRVIEAAPIVKFMMDWTADKVRKHVAAMGWTATVSKKVLEQA